MRLWALIGLAFCLPAAIAQTEPDSGQLSGFAALGQQSFLQLLVARNLEVQFSRLNSEVTRHLMEGEAGLYETTLFLGARGEGRERQRTADERVQSSLVAAGTAVLEETGRTDEVGIRNRLPWGSELSLSYKRAKKTNNLIPQYNNSKYDTEYNTLLNLTLKQPLLRNFGRNVTETDRRVAELEHQIALRQFNQQILKTAVDGLNLYWQLYRAEATLALRRSAYAGTESLLADAQERIKAGKLPASAVLELQGVLANRQAEVLRAQQDLLEGKGKLATALHLLWTERLGLSTKPLLQSFDLAMPSMMPPAEPALDMWQPFHVARLKLEQAQVRLEFAHNQTRPVADLILSYGNTGYDYSLAEAYTAAGKGSFPDWYVSLNIELPLRGNQKAQQQFLAQSTRVMQAELELDAIRNSFFNDLMVRHGEMVQARAVLVASRDEFSLRQAMLEREQQRHQLGVGLLRSLIQSQVDLTEAQQRLLENQVRFQVAMVVWQYTQGSLLREHDIEIDASPSFRR